MILRRLAITLLKHRSPVTLYLKGVMAKDSNGDYVEPLAVSSVVEWPSTPISGRQLYLSDAGAFTTEDRNLFQLEPCSVDVKFNDEFVLGGTIYVIRDVKDMRNEAGFIRYLAKKKNPQKLAEVKIEVIE